MSKVKRKYHINHQAPPVAGFFVCGSVFGNIGYA